MLFFILNVRIFFSQYLFHYELKKDWEMIADFKIELITKCRQFLDIKTTLLLASDMNVQGKKAKSKTLMANKGSKEYLEKDKIEISYHNYDFFKHIQTGEILCKDLSYLDLLFSESTKSKHFI